MFLWSTVGVLLAIACSVVGDESNASCPTPAENNRPGSNPLGNSHLHKHDGSFEPDFYLSVTYENHTVACQHRMSFLVNGTSPGPPLRLTPGKTSWVRVCNDMEMYNTTMVRQICTARKVPY
jgi:L-ascorbate oxidase